MTTTVIIQYPKPNHLCARVFRQQKDATGKWVSVGCETISGENQLIIQHVHGHQRLIIEERAGNYLPSHPEMDHPATDDRDEHDEWMRANGARAAGNVQHRG